MSDFEDDISRIQNVLSYVLENISSGDLEFVQSILDCFSAEQKEEPVGPFKVFISHSSAQVEAVMAVKGELERAGFEVLVDRSIKTGTVWSETLISSLRSCEALIYYSSPEANESAWCQQEIGWALGRGIPVFPVNRGEMPKAFIMQLQACTKEITKEFIEMLLGDGHTPPAVDEAAADRIVDGLIAAFSDDKAWGNWGDIWKAFHFLELVPNWNADRAAAVKKALTDHQNVLDAMRKSDQQKRCKLKEAADRLLELHGFSAEQ